MDPTSDPADTGPDLLTLVPPRRLGGVLSGVRSARGLTLEEVAEATSGRFSVAALAAAERGVARLDDGSLRFLADVYGLDTVRAVPQRSTLVIDLDEGFLAVADRRSGLTEVSSRPEVLARYLALVHSMRGTSPGDRLAMRVEDVAVLGRALSADPDEIAVDLDSLMVDPTPQVERRFALLQRRVLIPSCGVLLACVAAGALVMVSGSDPSTVDPSPPPVSGATSSPREGSGAPVPTEIGTPTVQERGSDTATEREVETRIIEPLVVERTPDGA